MKAEKYLIDYIMKNNISIHQVEVSVGINMEEIMNHKRELNADEFMRVCIFLGVNPDDVMETVI